MEGVKKTRMIETD